jgi:hypothetical protein
MIMVKFDGIEVHASVDVPPLAEYVRFGID